MATFKALCMAVMLVTCSIIAGGANARGIDYGVIVKGDPNHCSGVQCIPQNHQPYNRGCEKETECRGVHFWAPTFKWVLSIANVVDFSKPPEELSYPQQTAVACSGVIWSRYSTVISPKNWNLFSVNVAMAGTGIYQLSRKLQ
ncbi:hypothetical protein FNV43_RR07895 [Rhamnella rubrinervis]|uniref:Mitochondrial pyruvate carrier n=1 Tax=Rhamnella rubrinervis TaxID=2594499 RepID=A0A8K0HHG5_9ROSA|nr:hypothetical protein FNV43_RR07895 [Rhamnella rubrinervis]